MITANGKYPIQLSVFGYNEQNVRPKMDFHEHISMELNYIVSGDATICYKDPKTGVLENIEFFQGSFVLIRPNIIHSINSNTNIKYFVLQLTTENKKNSFVEFLKQSNYVKTFPEAGKILENWNDLLLFKDTQNVSDLLNEFRIFYNKEFANHFYNAQLEIRLKQLFLSVIQCAADEKKTSGQNIHIKRALSYLQTNYDKALAIKNIANYVGVSPTHLHRTFKETLGKTVICALNEIRIDKAAQMLEKSNYSIKTTWKATGFNSMQAFLYNFKKYKNQNPSEYKKEKLSTIVRIDDNKKDYYYIFTDIKI